MTPPNNPSKVKIIEARVARLLAEALVRDWYGEVGIVVSVQDGQIQHIREKVDRIVQR